MKRLLLVLLSSCGLTARPIDIVHPRPISCQVLNEARQVCQASDGFYWDCAVVHGRWECIRR